MRTPVRVLNLGVQIWAVFAATASGVFGQQVSFSLQVFPVFEKAGCPNCHNPNGVASATRLHFPDEDAPKPRIEAFGRSLVDLVDRNAPDGSLLLLKPTNRVPHGGGVRIARNSPEEATLKAWIAYLTTLSGSELAGALKYKQEEAAGRGVAPTAVLRRLTHSQYNNTVHDLLHEASSPAGQFPLEDFVNGFKDQYEALSISPIQGEAYALAAERLAANAFRRGDSRGLLACKPDAADSTCGARFVQSFGLRAFRRPLTVHEMARYGALFSTQKDVIKGAQLVIEAMLQSPNFLFWLDETPNPQWKPYATASRLSYFLWNTMPDDALLNSAAHGELSTPDGLERVARRMLADPKARQGLDEFVSEWLRFDRVTTAARERRMFPLFSRELATAMTEEAKRFIGDLVWNDRDFTEAFTANHSFINSDLAAVYKVSPPARDFDRVEFPLKEDRAGLLGQALFLTLTSKPEGTAPTGRGLFVREQFLCQHVPPPPPGVDTNLPPVEESRPMTNRDRMALHATNKMCAGCHSLIDPIGFAFEKFDAIGMYHDKAQLLFMPVVQDAVKARSAKPREVYLDVDTTGVITGLKDARFTNPREIGELLAHTAECQECMVKQVFRYMAGRLETPADRPALHRAFEDFRNSHFRFKEMLVSLVMGREVSPAGKDFHVARNYQTQ
ncbi:MAG: DUF1592 domain-containing protein [Acidobacteriia bacterium]|nr:DUF1592 domain-containing protein [Terriglobia bacterium]